VKKAFLISMLVAILFGPATAFVNYVAWTHVRYRYEPPVSETEMQQWEQGSVAHLKAEIAKRQVSYSRAQWLRDSIGELSFWTFLAKMSLVPTLSVFLACICFGGIAMHPRPFVR
jgi:hypothetical protein